MEYGHYEITIKETGREKPVSTEYHGFINHEGLVSFFGLKEPDVEWYDIRKITWPYTGCNIWNSGGRTSGYVRSNNTGPLKKHLNKISRQGRILPLPFCRPSSDRQGD